MTLQIMNFQYLQVYQEMIYTRYEYRFMKFNLKKFFEIMNRIFCSCIYLFIGVFFLNLLKIFNVNQYFFKL